MNHIEKSIKVAEKYHNPNDGEVTETFLDIIKRYESFVERSLKLSEDFEKDNEKLSEKFLNIAIKYDKFIEEEKKKLNF